MTGRATFGDFSRLASSQLDQAIGPPAVSKRNLAKARAGQMHDVIRSLDDVVGVMNRYCADITSTFAGFSARQLRMLGGWPRASIQAQEAVQNAAAFLRAAQAGGPRRSRPRTESRAASGLDAAVISLAVGHDLLHTHFATGRDGERLARSEWAPVITSAPVTRALLLELGLWAGTAARRGADLALSGPPVLRGTEGQRRKLNAACQWLWILDATVLDAHRHDPVSAVDADLLHAIPVNALAPRQIPAGDETVTRLCHGTTGTAERVRHAAVAAVPQAAWSPALTAESFRQTAASATVISHNCATVLSSLAVLAQQRGVPDLTSDLLTSARAAAARTTWLAAAQAWSRITTDARAAISPAAAEAADLALWTGRIAYADPGWTPTDSPFSAYRPPQALAPEPGDMGNVVAAVHQACETLTSLAAADHAQIGTAARAGRLLVPTRSLPDTFDVPHPFAPAPRDRIRALLATYHDARTASAQATVTVAHVAADVRAPSRILTTARAAVRAGSGPAGHMTRVPATPPARSSPAHELPGPVERILQDLGVTSTDVLHHAAAIDQAGEQLILDAAQAADLRRPASATAPLSRSVGTAEIINHMLASGNPGATAFLRPPSPRSARSVRPDPDHYAKGQRLQPGHPVARQTPELEAEP